jgi:hypothetical protein
LIELQISKEGANEMNTMETPLVIPGKRTALPLTRKLLLCGAIAGPLFLLTPLIQDYTRPGYDPRLDVLSLLSLGDWGWVQITNFVLAGVLNLLYAVGLWRRLHSGRAGTWGPILIGAYGLGLVTVGVFRTDPANGFPPGAVTGSSWHGMIHGFGALFVFMMLAAALAVFVRFFLARKERGWAWYCLASVVLLLLCFFGGFVSAASGPLLLQCGVLVGWIAASVIAIKLFCSPETTPPTHVSPDARKEEKDVSGLNV